MRVTTSRTAGVLSAVGLNQFADSWTGKLPCRRNAKENPRNYREDCAENQNGSIDSNRSLMGKRVQREHGRNGPHSAIGNQYSQSRAHNRQQDGLGQQLPDQTIAAGADRRSNRQLMLARNSARQ